MRTIRFYGASDDLFEIEPTKADEPAEINCYDEPAVVSLKDAKGNGFRVSALYGLDAASGCWTIGVAPLEEGKAIPKWPTTFALNGNGYSAVLTVECPDDVVVAQTLPAPDTGDLN